MRIAKVENVAKEIKKLAQIQKRQIKKQSLKPTTNRARGIDIRAQKIRALKQKKALIPRITKAKRKATIKSLLEKYKQITTPKQIKAETDEIYNILERRKELDSFYADNIKNKSVQFLKGLDYYLRARNIDITDILQGYDMMALSDAIYANVKDKDDIKEVLFGYKKVGKTYILVKENKTEVLEALKDAVDPSDRAKIDKILEAISVYVKPKPPALDTFEDI